MNTPRPDAPSAVLARLTLLGLALGAASCGNAELIAPEPLLVLDTSPANGAQVAPGETPVVVTFGAALDPTSLSGAVALERTSGGGVPLEPVPLGTARYDADTNTLSFEPVELPASAYFTLTVRRGGVRSRSGALLAADLVRRFRTAAGAR